MNSIFPLRIPDWEQRFASAIKPLSDAERSRAGGVLQVIPARDEWDHFRETVRTVWRSWELAFARHPTAMVMLYDGVAFYRYESGNFWKGFADAAGAPPISGNEQRRINELYQVSARGLGLRVESGEYNSAAIRHIGVPISMWEGVLEVCEWALWAADWRDLSESRWRDAMVRRLGGRTRLIEFLVENREAATERIQEMLDARKWLRDDRTMTLSELSHVCQLRREYFEEVPETADFLREDDPDSLFVDRARLSWDEQRDTFGLHLPPVAHEKLPGHWRLAQREKVASSTAGELVVDGAAFAQFLKLELCAGEDAVSQRVAGIDEWALWDESKSRFVPRRDHLPLAQYTLISKAPLKPRLEGWAEDPDDPATDLAREASDGTSYYITRLNPASRRPRLKIGEGSWFVFTQRRGVTLRVFCGTNPATAARFGISSQDMLRVEEWPRPFLEVPLSLLPDDEINAEFSVMLDNQEANGRWVTYSFEPDGTDETNAERALCFWKWDDPPRPEPNEETSLHRSFDSLDRQSTTRPCPNRIGRHSLYVQSRRLGRLSFGQKTLVDFEMLPATSGSVWPAKWGCYLAWILLSQVQDEATWEEVRFASEAVTMWTKVNLNTIHYAIHKLERHDYLAIRGHRYINFRSRIALSPPAADGFTADYCGLSTALYELIRAVPPLGLEVAPPQAGRPPSLQLRWPQRERSDVRLACERNEIQIVNKLW